MLWPILGSLFALSVLSILVLLLMLFFKPKFWLRNKTKILISYSTCFFFYFIFIIFFTGPVDTSVYPSQAESPYKLPWERGVSRLVVQGNRSFTSHRGPHFHAWDFLMINGTEILAARAGKVVEVEDRFDGIGLHSNQVVLKHEGGQSSGYYHIQKNGALVKIGDTVTQGQPIALSGMVGQTSFPHVHFVVYGEDGKNSIPMSFSDVPGGLALAGHIYKSENALKR
jgi:murein DD-endopeptidase MepM/ murein hydrolase activator NlpD